MDLIAQNSHDVHTIVLHLLALDHPHISLTNIFTFLWCLWKMRNEKLFNNLNGQPNQVIIRTNALLNSLQIHKAPALPAKPPQTPLELSYSGPKFFVDAAWKRRPNGQPSKACIGIHLTWKHGQQTTDVFVSAKTIPVSTPIQAEAEGLLLAADITSSIMLQEPFFFTDNLNLAKAIQEKGGTNPTVIWEIRRQAVQFHEKLNSLHPRIKHINRALNAIAHSFAEQAKTRHRVSPTCSCNNPTHSTSSCPVSVAIHRLSLSGTIIVSVQCL
jgi:hypothetical protein